jgi:4-amino-4-deoxychorismate lyase
MSAGLLQSWINGQQADQISALDRGFQYGDGCFETIRVRANTPILWQAHLDRLLRGCAQLSINIDSKLLQQEVSQFLQCNESKDAILKIIVTRGTGGRGYQPNPTSSCNRFLQLFHYTNSKPDAETQGIQCILCQHRLSSNSALAGLKHLNRIDQVLASQEIPPSCDEGLCMNQQGFVIEASKSNLMLVVAGQLITPALLDCGVAGTMLDYLSQRFTEQGMQIAQQKLTLDDLAGADELFLCNSVFGVWPVTKVYSDDAVFSWEIGPCTQSAIQIKKELFNHAS